MAIRRVTGAVSPSELIFADANALGTTYDGTGTTIERGETFTLPSAGTTAVSNGALRLEALKGDCTITNNGNSTLTNASGVNGTVIMRSGTSEFPAFVRNSSMGSMSTPAREDFTGSLSNSLGTFNGTINSNATFPTGHTRFLAKSDITTFSGATVDNYIHTAVETGTFTVGSRILIQAQIGGFYKTDADIESWGRIRFCGTAASTGTPTDSGLSATTSGTIIFEEIGYQWKRAVGQAFAGELLVTPINGATTASYCMYYDEQADQSVNFMRIQMMLWEVF